jgi:methyl-accepting chemotaxis protein
MSAADRATWLTSGSIQKSLLKALLVTTGGALALTAALLALIEIVDYRRGAEADLSALSGVIALYSQAALDFGDPAAGLEALAALQNVPRIQAAILYGADGSVFAKFGQVDEIAQDARLTRGVAYGVSYGASHMDLVRAIEHDGKRTGTLMIRRDTADLAQAMAFKLAVLGVALVGALLLAAFLAKRLGRHIAQPLEAQVAASAAVADGDLSIRVPETASGELGELARAFNTMTAGLRALITQVGSGVTEVVAVSHTLEERGGQLGKAASAQADAIGEATDSIERVEESIRSVNHGVEQLAETAEQTSGFAVEMDASIGEVVSRMDELTQAIAATSAAIAQVTSSIRNIARSAETLQEATTGTAQHLEELTRTVSSVAAYAAESSSLSQDSSRAAGEGMSVVREASAAMDAISTSFESLQECVARLSQRSASIDEIVQVITEIADETKLLALNASIIAAQAGEGGAAFSVVAREVRELAERTHRSAGEITSLIRATQEDTSAAVSAVADGSARITEGVQRSAASAQMLQRILETSTTSAARTREIAEATTRQASDLDRVGVAVREIDEAVEAIRTSTREQELSSEEIAKRVESIRDLGSAVRESTQEQRRGSSLVSKAATQMSETLSQIVGATDAQSRSGETIGQTLRVFSEVSAETVRAAEAITGAVSTLLKRAEWLEEESRRFHTAEEQRGTSQRKSVA